MKYSLLILIAFIMNACMMQPATEEDMNAMKTSWAQSTKLQPGSSGQALTLQHPLKPDTYTVTFGIDGDDLSQIDVARRTVATLQWSVNGNTVTRVIDVLNGTAISGRAEQITLRVVDASTSQPGGPALSTLNPYVVTAILSQGTRPSVNQPPILTEFPAILDAVVNPQQVFLVPSGAISVQVTVGPSTLDANPILQQDVLVTQFAGITGAFKAYSPIDESGFIPLATGVTSIVVSRRAAALVPVIIANVTFGVDG